MPYGIRKDYLYSCIGIGIILILSTNRQMLNAAKILPYYTYDDWINWKGQWELIEGIPYAISPMPAPKHQRIANALSAEFYFALKECKTCGTYQPIDYKISEDTILQPDILIVCEPIEKNFLDFPPALVVEILSPSTVLKDRHAKFSIYQEQQIKYYIILSMDPEEAEIYTIENNGYQLKQKGRDFTYTFFFKSDCAATINCKEIW